MNLIEVLLYQDKKQLIKLVKSNDDSKINSKRELVETIYPRLICNTDLKKRFDELSDNAKKVSFILCFDHNLFHSKEELHGIIPKVSKEGLARVVEELMDSGVLFSYSNENYLIPMQIKNNLLTILQEDLKEFTLILPSKLKQLGEISIIEDFFTFIDTVMEKPLPLTKTGSIHKKDFLSIMKSFNIQEELPSDQWRFGYGRRFAQYPDRFSLIYDFCYSHGWIAERDQCLYLGSKVSELDSWKVDDFIKSLVLFWFRLYRRAAPTINEMTKLLFLVLEEGTGIEEETIVASFLPFVSTYYFDQKEDIIQKRLLKMLVYMNCLEEVQMNGIKGYTIGSSYKYVKEIL